MKITDFKKGETVWILLTGNMARNKQGTDRIEEWEVVSVGRKYITAKSKNIKWTEIKFEQKNEDFNYFTQVTPYSPDYSLYKTRKDIEDLLEKEELQLWLRQNYNRPYSLEQLRKAKAILEGENSKLKTSLS